MSCPLHMQYFNPSNHLGIAVPLADHDLSRLVLDPTKLRCHEHLDPRFCRQPHPPKSFDSQLQDQKPSCMNSLAFSHRVRSRFRRVMAEVATATECENAGSCGEIACHGLSESVAVFAWRNHCRPISATCRLTVSSAASRTTEYAITGVARHLERATRIYWGRAY